MKNLTNAQAPTALVGAIIASYGATSCTIDKGSFLRVEGAVRRTGNLNTSEGFDVAYEGENYRFHTVEIEKFGRNYSVTTLYRMEQY